MEKISAFIIAYNEYYRIMQCVSSLIGNVDQIVIVDDGSDQVDLLQLYEHIMAVTEWHGIESEVLAKSRLGSHALHLDTALEACKHDWVLQLDADEVLLAEIGGLKKDVLVCNAMKLDACQCMLTSYVQNGTEYTVEMKEPKIRFFNKNNGHYPKEHGVGWVVNDDKVLSTGGHFIKHIRTIKEKQVDSLRYLQNYVKAYLDTNDAEKKKYYSDKFDRICEYYKFPFKSIGEVIAKGVEECIVIVKSQWE